MEKKHSLLGISSFALATLAFLAGFALLAIAVLLGQIDRVDRGVRDFGHALLFLCLLALLFANLVAAGLGAAALLQPDRKRVFAVLGTVISGLQLLLALVLVLARLLD